MTHQPGYLQSTFASRSRSPEKKKISITIPKEKDIEEKEFLTSSLEPSPASPVIPQSQSQSQSQSPFSASPSTIAALAEVEDEAALSSLPFFSLPTSTSPAKSAASPHPSAESAPSAAKSAASPHPSAESTSSAEEAAVHTPPTPKSSSYQTKSNMEGLVESIPTYHGKKDGSEDAAEWLELLNFVVEDKYAEEDKRLTVKKMAFRVRLRDKAAKWYQNQSKQTRQDWSLLSAAFLLEYPEDTKVPEDPNKFFNLLHNLRQGKKPIAQYVEEAEELYQNCPEKLKEFMGSQFLAGIADEAKVDMAQMYLQNETVITFPLAKAAVIKAYSRIGRASPFDTRVERSSSQEVTQNEVNLELMKFFKGLQMAPKVQPVIQPQPYPPPAPQQKAAEYQKPLQVPGGYSQPNPAYRNPRQMVDVICHNCLEPGHYSTNCPEPQVSYRQKAINRSKAEEMMDLRTKTNPPPAAAKAAAVQFSSEHLKAKGPLSEISGNAGRTEKYLPVTPVVLRRGQTLESLSAAAAAAVSADKENIDGMAAPANRVQKPQAKTTAKQKSQRAAKEAAERALETLSPRLPGNRIEDVTDEMEQDTPDTMVGDLAGKQSQIVRLPLPPSMSTPPPPVTVEDGDDGPEEVDDEPESSATGAKRKGKEKEVRFQIPPPPPPVVQVIDPPTPAWVSSAEPQRRLPTSRRVVETYDARPAEKLYEGPKETVPINMAKEKSRFEISQFLDATVQLPLWQLLDRSPQIRAQLARAMASSKPSRRGRKAAVALVAGKKAPPIETEAFDEADEVVCLYIRCWVGDVMVEKTLVDTGAVVELINPKMVVILDLEVFEMDEEWTLQLADDRLAKVKQYVWLPVNVAGIVAVVRAFILGLGDIYDILLSKRWMQRVRAVEDHGKKTLSIQGKDEEIRVVHGSGAESVEVGLIDGPSVDDWETSLAEEEIARLADELDGFDYAADSRQGKGVRR